MSEGGGGFLSRWSRRKRAATVAPPAEPPAAAPVPPEGAPPEAEAPPGGAPPPAFDPASLPPVESLTAESDFAAFLRDEVPAALRQAALRRAWTLDPAIRDFVGPADYAWDYNAPGGVPGFSFNLTGDLERLVAQAIGAAPPVAKEGPPGGAPPSAEAAALPSPEPAAAESAPGQAPSAEAAAQEEPAPEALPAAPAAVPVADASPVRRRHGGAVPS